MIVVEVTESTPKGLFYSVKQELEKAFKCSRWRAFEVMVRLNEGSRNRSRQRYSGRKLPKVPQKDCDRAH